MQIELEDCIYRALFGNFACRPFPARSGIAKLILGMMIREIPAKTLLIPCKDPDIRFGVRYRFNIYRNCQHQCIDCDSRGERYGIKNFTDMIPGLRRKYEQRY